MEYYLISSVQYPSRIFSIIPVSINGIKEPLIEEGLDLREIKQIPVSEVGITQDFEVDLTRGSKAYYRINQISKIEAMSLVKQYRK